MKLKALEGSFWYSIGYLPTEAATQGFVEKCDFMENKLSIICGEPDSGISIINAESSNGYVYKGTYNAKDIEDIGTVTLYHYVNGISHVFYGQWESSEENGTYLFELVES